MAVSSWRKLNLPLLCATCVRVREGVRLGMANVFLQGQHSVLEPKNSGVLEVNQESARCYVEVFSPG